MREAVVKKLERAALTWVREHAGLIGLNPAAVSLRAVLNWGGFVNTSFHVTDGAQRFYLKFAVQEESAGLATWWRVRDHLAERYRAPQLLRWIALPEVGCVGALFEHLQGSAPATLSPGFVEPIVSLLAGLHGDTQLRSALEGGALTCLEDYRNNHDRRFREDLAGIRETPPPFLEDGDLEWMTEEVELLREAVGGSPAFHEPAVVPIHGDLWIANLLVTPGGSWHLLDWDELRLGDPVLDYATLLGPSPRDLRPAQEAELPAGALFHEAERERLRLYARATLLDWIVDALSDWLEAECVLPDAQRFREEKERIHREAKDLYRDLYRSR